MPEGSQLRLQLKTPSSQAPAKQRVDKPFVLDSTRTTRASPTPCPDETQATNKLAFRTLQAYSNALQRRPGLHSFNLREHN